MGWYHLIIRKTIPMSVCMWEIFRNFVPEIKFDNVWIGKFFASSSINAARIVAVESIVQTQ